MRQLTARLCVHHQVCCVNLIGGVVSLPTRPCADGAAGMDVLLTEQSCAALVNGGTPQKVIHGLQARVRARGDFLLGTYCGSARYGAGGERDSARWLKAAHLAEYVRGGRFALPHAAAVLSALADFGGAAASPLERASAAGASADTAVACGAAVPEAEIEERPAAPRVRKPRAQEQPAAQPVPKKRAAASGSASAVPTAIEVFVPAPELGVSAAGPVQPCSPSTKKTEKPPTRRYSEIVGGDVGCGIGCHVGRRILQGAWVGSVNR